MGYICTTSQRLTRKFVASQKEKGLYPYVCANEEYKPRSGQPKIITQWYSLDPEVEVIADTRMFRPGDIVLYTGPPRYNHSKCCLFETDHIYRIHYVYNTHENTTTLHRAGVYKSSVYRNPNIPTEQVRHVEMSVFLPRKRVLWELKFSNMLLNKIKDMCGFEKADLLSELDRKRVYIMQRLILDPSLKQALEIELNDLCSGVITEELFEHCWRNDMLRVIDEQRDMAKA